LIATSWLASTPSMASGVRGVSSPVPLSLISCSLQSHECAAVSAVRGRSRTLLVTRHAKGNGNGSEAATGRRPEELAVEEPMEIRLDGVRVATTMRTPGHDYELAVGWCLAEGVLAGAPILGVRYCATGSAVETEFNVVTVDTGGRAPTPEPRLTTATSSCGLCGSASLAELAERLSPLPPTEPFGVEFLMGLPEQVRPRQSLYRSTGAVHGAAAITRTGEILAVREDIGRHNAVDKVVGRLHMDGRLPARDLVLYVSGRASFEIVQKAWAAGFGAVVAVSAPSALAVETALTAGMQLVGFVRDGAGNVYA
jgi:FdhD protein